MGSAWAVENYIIMSLLPGIGVMRQFLSDEAIKEFMPQLEKMVLDYKMGEVKDEV